METSAILTSVTTVGAILASMAAIALLETAIPLRARGRWNRAHLGPNLALTFLTFATNAVFGAALVMLLAWQRSSGLGLLQLASPPPWLEVAIVVGVLDFAF